MTGKKIDRRVKYTKTMLKDSLVELLRDQHVSTISIKALCEKADINRSTFYAHYKDQYDLLHQMEAEVMENVTMYLDKQTIGRNTERLPNHLLTHILEYARNNAELFQVLLSENSDYLFQKDIIGLSNIFSLQFNQKMDAKLKDYLKEFGTAGCISIFQKWLKEGMTESPEELSGLIVNVLQFGMFGLQKDLE